MGRALGKGGGETVTTNSAPWEKVQPYLEDVFGRGKQLYNKGPMQYYGGQLVAPMSGYTRQAIDDSAASSNDPNSVTNLGRNEFSKTIRGDYLGPESNPYLEQTVSRALGMARSGVNSTFGRGGGNNFGSSAHEELLAKNLADTALPYYLNNYNTERGRQFTAAQSAPGMDAAAMAGLKFAGSAEDSYNQALINAEKEKFQFNQQAPWDALQRYQASISGVGGGSQQQPYYPSNPLADTVGLASSTAGIYGMGKDYGWWGA